MTTVQEKRPSNVLTFQPRKTDTLAGVGPIVWVDIAADYNAHLRVNTGRETPRTYMSAASIFARWCEAEGTTIATADSTDLTRWYASEIAAHAKTTAVNRMLAVRHLYRWMVEQDYCVSDPTQGLRAIRSKSEPQKPFTPTEIRAMLRAARAGGYEKANAKRDTALLLLLIDSAARRGEILSLETTDIDWRRCELLIRHGKGDKERRVAFGESTKRALREYVGNREGSVFLNQEGTPMSGKSAWYQIRAIAEKAGVINAFPHRFRTTAANRFMERGMALDELQRVLGHAQISTTSAYAGYTAATRALDTQRRLVQQPSMLIRFAQGFRRRLGFGT